jgi:hypothetical protein
MVLPIHLVDGTVALKIYIGQHSQHNQMVKTSCRPHAALQMSCTCYMLWVYAFHDWSMQLLQCVRHSGTAMCQALWYTVKKLTCLENNSCCETWKILTVVRLKVNKHFVPSGLQNRWWLAVVTTELSQYPATASAVPVNHSHKVIVTLLTKLHKKSRESVTITYTTCSKNSQLNGLF